jgi:hypothetical protein
LLHLSFDLHFRDNSQHLSNLGFSFNATNAKARLP